MRIHEQDQRFYVLDDIEEARQFRTGKGLLSRLFADKVTNIVGAVHKSSYLQALSASCANLNPDHLPIAREERKFSKGRVSFRGDHTDVLHLNEVAAKVGNYLEPLYGDTMFMGIYVRGAEYHELHRHPGVTTASLPLGIDRLSTVWKNEAGKLVTTEPDSLVVMNETILHGSPKLDGSELFLTISSYHRNFQ